MIVSYVARYGLQFKQLDIKGAYLYSDVEPSAEIYMEQPEGFVIPGTESKVLRLRKICMA